jgi:hypothetical protein
MNSISFGKTTITSYPEYFEIADNKKTNKLLYLSASLVFIAIYLFDLYQNDFDFGKVSHFKTISAVLWLVIFALQFWLINTESKIEKSKIKEVVVRKNRWASIVIHYGDKKRKIDGFSQDEAEQIIKFLMNNR